MKKIKLTRMYIICLCLMSSVLLSACTQKAVVPDAPDFDSESVNQPVNETANGETGQADESEQADETGQMNELEQTDESEQVNEPEQTADSPSRELTQEEIAFFDEYLSTSGNWGFLLSVYASPEDIDLNELFYSGAGLSGWTLTEEEAADFIEASGGAEIYTDVVHLTTPQIDAFLLERTGLSYEQMNKQLDWVYSVQTDTWYSQAGDTNWRPFACVSGTVSDDVYTLYMRVEDPYPGYLEEVYETVLKKNGDGYQFVSNLLMEE